ncbi:MAG: segregation/condensation protein A [Candidatus Melainabacteria bacterium]|nr:segregation/condensation protein A [Candidatus Melainabacteria bacterium]
MEQVEQNKQITDFKNLGGGLELLVGLAEKGEIDPWDIDIIEVTNKYLQALDKTPRENLLNAGRAIFFASVLLRLKSDILLNISNETLMSSQATENFFPEDELLLHGQDGFHLDISRLESYLSRSSLCKQQRKRKISLSDLIFALKQAEEEEEKRTLRARLRAERAFTIAPLDGGEDILEIVQDDDVEDFVEKVEAVVQEHLTDEKPITLSFLTEILNNKVKPFLALLFLAHSQKVVLEQKEMYGEVFIYKGGVILEDVKEAEKKKPKKKKSIIEKVKDKVIEVITK